MKHHSHKATCKGMSTHSNLLAALEGCITEHQSLHEAEIFHWDISVNNLMINEDKKNPSWPSSLTGLDLVIRQHRDGGSDIVVYSDASGRQVHLGAAAVMLDNNLEVSEFLQIQVGPMDRWSIHAAELIWILQAINHINKFAFEHRQSTAHEFTIRLQWIPGHCAAPENDSADRLAKEAAIPNKIHPLCLLLSREKAFVRNNIHAQWEKEWKEAGEGGHRIDNALPAKYSTSDGSTGLYRGIEPTYSHSYEQDICWLATFAKAFRPEDNDRCVCGDRETLKHVMWDCPDLRELQRELREKVGDAFNDVSRLLGGSQEERRSQIYHASRAKTVDAVLDFAEASQRFRSCAPRGQLGNVNGN